MLHNTVKQFYNKVLKPLLTIEVKSSNGWNVISSLNIMDDKDCIEIIDEDDNALVCTPDHIMISDTGDEIFAKNLLGRSVSTVNGPRKIKSIRDAGSRKIYDLSLIQNHTYFTNSFLSHNCVIIDECAFIPNNVTDAFFASVYPVISSSKNSKAILVSTPNGVGNLYYELWQQSNSKNQAINKDGWQPFRVDWWEVPGRDEEWKNKQINSIGIEKFRQEFGNEFIASSYNKLIPDDLIEKYRMELGRYKAENINQGTDIEVYGSSGNDSYTFRMYSEFNPDRTYLATADVADGTGGDSSVLYIWDVTDLSHVRPCAKFSSNSISVIEFAFVISKICNLFGNPYLALESNSIGRGLIDQLQLTYNYENFVCLNKHGEPGIMSHVQIKSKACTWYREMMTTLGFHIDYYDKDIIDEMESFVKKNTQNHLVYNALKGQHDDSIINAIWMAYTLSPDVIENYFVVVEHFTSSLGKVLPKRLMPLNSNIQKNKDDIDPMIRQWNKFKDENAKQFANAVNAEERSNQVDPFFRKPQKNIFDSAFEAEGGNFFSDGGFW